MYMWTYTACKPTGVGLESWQKRARHTELQGMVLIWILIPSQQNAEECYIMSVFMEHISILLLGTRI